MTTTLEIRATIAHIGRNVQEVVGGPFPEQYAQAARLRFDELVRCYPEVYFELVSVNRSEVLIAFTPINVTTKKPGPPTFV